MPILRVDRGAAGHGAISFSPDVVRQVLPGLPPASRAVDHSVAQQPRGPHGIKIVLARASRSSWTAAATEAGGGVPASLPAAPSLPEASCSESESVHGGLEGALPR